MINRSLFNKGIRGTVIAAALISLVAHWEGYRERAYLDLVGVPTIGYGETKGVKLGQRTTEPEARKKLIVRIKQFEKEILACIPNEIPFEVQAAFTSAAYNLGSPTICKSTAAKLVRAGKLEAGCKALRAFNKARTGPRSPKTGKRQLEYSKGLDNRRVKEVQFCLKGVK